MISEHRDQSFLVECEVPLEEIRLITSLGEAEEYLKGGKPAVVQGPMEVLLVTKMKYEIDPGEFIIARGFDRVRGESDKYPQAISETIFNSVDDAKEAAQRIIQAEQ